jgi:hypothetical protein
MNEYLPSSLENGAGYIGAEAYLTDCVNGNADVAPNLENVPPKVNSGTQLSS